MTYSPEQYTVYYTTNSSSCPDSDDGYDKSVTVYGLNHTEFYTIRDQQYSVTLNNLHPYTVYCYKVVVTNTVGRNESTLSTFRTGESGELVLCTDGDIVYMCTEQLLPLLYTVIHNYQFPVARHRTLLFHQSTCTLPSSHGLLLSLHNVMESSSAILLSAMEVVFEPAVLVLLSHF